MASKRVNPNSKAPNRLRSRSVAASPRTVFANEFVNKRDNPLFCSSSPSSSSPGSETGGDGENEEKGRGRSASRTSGIGSFGGKSGRSYSTVDLGRSRMRSISREPSGKFESDTEDGYKSASSSRNKNNSATASFTPYRQCKSECDFREQTKSLRTWAGQQSVTRCWDTSSADHSQDGTGTDIIFETVRSEVRRAVYEIRDDLENVIQSKNPSVTSRENIIEIPPEFLNDTVELVTDIRREYASKLEQSQERARQLRADLAVEQQREQELSRILMEVHQAPKDSGSRKKYRPKRRASIERRRLSRDLAEDAMNYFDECVSISTFDSSEFSSLEDPSSGTIIGIPPVGSSRFYATKGPNSSVANFLNRDASYDAHILDLDNQTQCSLSSVGSELAISSYCSSTRPADAPKSGSFQFTFAREPMEHAITDDDIQQFIKKFEKETCKERIECADTRSTYDPENYELTNNAESVLFDRIIFGNRIESGGLVICNIRSF